MSVKKIRGRLSCSSCYNQFDDGLCGPRTLDCRHTFCHSCLQALAEQDATHTVKCPTCRAEMWVWGANVSSILTNFQLLDVVHAMQDAESEEKQCEICELSHAAALRCVQCEQFMCESQGKYHLKIKATCPPQVTNRH
jgi:phage FluMu protein Com